MFTLFTSLAVEHARPTAARILACLFLLASFCTHSCKLCQLDQRLSQRNEAVKQFMAYTRVGRREAVRVLVGVHSFSEDFRIRRNIVIL